MNGTPPRFQSYLKSLTLLLVMGLSVNMWGADVTSMYSTGFEKCPTGTNYQGTVTIDSEKGDGASWKIYYGCVSTSSKISGNNSAHLRLYKDQNCGYLEQTSNIATVDSINFTYIVSNSAVRFDVKYSTNSGSSWTTLASVVPSGTSETTLAYRLSARAATFRLKIEVTGGHPSSSNYTFRIDDINYSKIETASKTPLTTPSGLTVGTTTSTSAPVSWNSVTDAGSYKVEYKTTSASNWMAVSPNPTTASCTITGLTPSTTYNWRVTAIPSASAATTKDNSSAANGDNFTTAAPASHDIIWYANGQQVAKNNQQEGAALAIPADPNPSTYCYGKTFVGWTANQTYSHETAAPGDLFTSKDSKTVGSTAAYYAVFADKDLSDSETEKEPKFALTNPSSLPSGWTTTATAGTSYLQMTSGNYVQNMNLKTAGILADGEVLSSAMSVVVSCGTYQTWSGDKKVTVKVDLLDASSNVLTTNNATFTSLGNKEDTDKPAISVDLPTDPTQFAGIKITVSDFVTGTTLRFKNVKLTYNVKTISYSNYTTTCAAVYEATVADGITNGSVVISKTDDAAAGTTSLTGLKQGDKVYIFPTANTGYNIESVSVNGTPISAQSGKYSFTIAEEGITVSASFVPATYQITYNLDGGEWTGAAGVASYTYGTGATLPTADDIAKANNTFLGWYVSNPAEIVASIGATETGDKSFIASWLPSGARDVTYSGGEQLNYISNPQIVDKKDPSLTVTYSVNKGYTISAVAVTVNDAALTESEVVFNDEQLTITPTAGFTGNVSITFTIVEKMFTVTWMANKTQFKQEQIQEGSKVTLPAGTPEDVISGEDTYKFQGWFTEEQYSNETTAPAYITNNTIEPAGDVTYYAVYAMKESSVVENSYVKGTKADLTEGQKVIIVNGNSKKALSSEDVSNTQTNYRKAIGVTITNNKISNTNNKLVWTVSLENNKYIFKQGTNYLNSTGNNLYCDGDKDTWTITAVSGNAGYTLLSTGGSKYLEYYSDYTEFTCYTGGSGNAFNMDFYIPETTETTKNYRTRVAVIDHIAVHGTPAETNFVAGETFDATGLTIDVYYQDEVEPTNVTSGFTYAPNGALKTTDENITFSYQGKQVLLPISVSNTVSGIEVTHIPNKMVYNEGEQFNPAGMEVTATYDNTAKRVVTGYTYEPTGDLALDDVITISFGGQTTELGITIKEATKTTVNWFVEGNAYTAGNPSTAVIPGKKITALPTEPNACQGNQFVGWTAVDANYYNATTAPTDLFKTLAAAPTIGETETNFYAVFAQVTATPVAESTVYTSNISDITGKKVLIADTQYDALQFGTSKTPQEAHDITVPAGTTTLTLHAASWNNSEGATLTASTDVAGVTIIPATAVDLVENTGLSSNSPWTITPDNTHEFFTFTLSGVKEATTITFENNNEERVVIWGVNASTTITSDYSTTCLAALANPTITTAEGTYCGSVDVEITQPAGNPEGAKIMYSTDNTNWNEYEAAVKLEASGTVYAKVVKDPKQTEVVSATYTVYPRYTLAQAAAAASATSQIACLTFTDLLVQARSQSEAFLKASDGQIVLLNKYNHGLNMGDKLVADNAHLNFIKSHDLLQLTSMEGIEKNGTGTPVADVKTITEITSANYGQLVKIMTVTYDATNKKFTDASSNEIAIDAKFFVGGSLPASWPDGGKFNATGVVVLDNNSNAVIAPRNTDDLESLATPLDAPTNFVVTSVNSYRASYSWTAVDNNVGYTLYIYDGDEQIYKSNTIGATVTEYAPQKNLEAGHTYTAKLVALGDKAEHSDSPAAEVEFTTNPNAKLNWYVGDNEEPYVTYASQEKVVTPEDPESPCATNYENFVTWYTEEIDGQIPALEASKKVKSGDAAASATTEQVYNFYAVFGKVQKAGTDKYVKVTESQDNWKGEYLIGYDEGDGKDALTVFNGSLTTLDAENDYKTVSLETDGSIVANETNNSYRFNIEKSTTEGYYTIQSASGKYIANTTSSNGMSESSTTAYKNTITWAERVDIVTGENATASHLSFNSVSDQLRFRYYKTDKKNIVLYKREKTNPQYSGYITTCPQTYTITIAENTKGVVEAATTTEILEGAKVQLTATANAGYTKTGGNWIVKNTTTGDVVDDPVGGTNYLTMPDYDVTIDYNFQEIKDQFVDNLHGNTTIEKGGANYELPTLSDFSGTTGAPSDAFKKFIGWSATSYDSGEPATEQPTILEGNQTATGATYVAVWYNGSSKYITEYCQTAVPTNLHLVEAYHKATSVRIDWNNVDGADKYHIIVMDGETNIIANADVTESLYDLSGLTPGATYYCTVKAHKNCWSDETELYEFITKENIQSYAVTINAEGGTYEIEPALDEDGKIQEGATVTISNIAVTDATIHYFKELTVPEATDLKKEGDNYTFTMPGKAVTINIVFAEFPKVTWMMEGKTYEVTPSVLQDDKFVVGTVQPAPATWTFKEYYKEFAGWMTNSDLENPVFATATTEVPADGLVVNGAVAKSGKADMDNATKVTSNANLDMTAHYVIGGEKNSTSYFFSDYESADTQLNWGQVTTDVTTAAPLVFTLSGTASELAIQDNRGNYLVEPSKNKTITMSSTKGTVSLDAIGNIVSGTSYYFRVNTNSGSEGVRWYDSKTCDQAYLYKVGLIYDNLTTDPSGTQIRPDAKVGMISGICYERDIVAHSGATFYYLSRKASDESYIELTEVTGILHAGYPYLFEASDNEIRVIFDGEEVNKANNYNGLYGTFVNKDLGDGYCIIVNNKYYRTHDDNNNGCYNHRAYLKLDEVNQVTIAPGETEEPVNAPRRIRMGGDGVNTPTGFDNILSGAESIRKMIINDKMYILRAGKMYDATGKFVK